MIKNALILVVSSTSDQLPFIPNWRASRNVSNTDSELSRENGARDYCALQYLFSSSFFSPRGSWPRNQQQLLASPSYHYPCSFSCWPSKRLAITTDDILLPLLVSNPLSLSTKCFYICGIPFKVFPAFNKIIMTSSRVC